MRTFRALEHAILALDYEALHRHLAELTTALADGRGQEIAVRLTNAAFHRPRPTPDLRLSQCIEILVRAGFDADTQCAKWLHGSLADWCVSRNLPCTLAVLLAHGADVDRPIDHGYSVRTLAGIYRYPEISALLAAHTARQTLSRVLREEVYDLPANGAAVTRLTATP